MSKSICLLIAMFLNYGNSFAQEKRPEDELFPMPDRDGATSGQSYLPGESPQQNKDLIDQVKKQPLPKQPDPELPKSEIHAPITHAPESELPAIESANPDASTDATKKEETPEAAGAPTSTDEPSHRFAVGFNLAWTTRQDYGARTFRRLTPEIIAFTYGALPWEAFWWRAGARLGYSTAQPEMPQTVRFEETDTTTLIEAAITRDWYVVPTFAFGGGYDFRRTKVKVSAPIDSADDRLNRKETLWMWYVQGGLGVPLLKARVLLEPTVRYHTIQYDARSHWLFGMEMTIGI